MSSLSRSAFSPALPTAMTMRPPLASSPAAAAADLAESHPALPPPALFACFPARHDDAAPVAVFARRRRLDERRIGDRHGDALGGLARSCALDLDRDEFARALAVANHLIGEVEQQYV